MENQDKYAAFTRDADWAGICESNGHSLDAFGTKKELKVLASYLEPGEIVYAITSGMMSQGALSNSSDAGSNTWVIALTNERFLLLDCALFTSSVDVQSIRLDRVQAVSSSQGWVLGKVMIDLGSRIATVDNCQKATVKPFSDLANKLLREREQINRGPAPQQRVDDDDLAKLEKLAQLHASGEFSRMRSSRPLKQSFWVSRPPLHCAALVRQLRNSLHQRDGEALLACHHARFLHPPLKLTVRF